MIHYTLLDPQVIWSNPNQDLSRLEERVIDGVRVIFNRNSDTTWSVARIISTNPADYLRPELQPGCLMRNLPIE